MQFSRLQQAAAVTTRRLLSSSAYTAGTPPAQIPSRQSYQIPSLPRTRRPLKHRHCTGPYHPERHPLPNYPKRRSPLRRTTALIDALNQEECLRMIQDGRAVFPKNIPEARSGDIIRITYVSNLAQERKQCFTGICMAVRDRGLGSTVVLRNIVHGVPVERGFPIYSPLIRDAEIIGKRKVSRAKLYYLRRKPLRESTFPNPTRLPTPPS